MKDEEIHKKFQLCGKNLRHWLSECKMMLPEIERREIYKKKGFENIYEYARIIAGLSRNQVNDSLRILEKIEDKPDLLKLAKKQGINKVKTLATIATQENQAQLAKAAEKMTVRETETFARDVKKDGRHVTGCTSKNGLQEPIEDLKLFAAKLKNETIKKLQKIKGEKTWDELLQELLEMRDEHFQQTAPPPKEEASRHVPKKIKTHIRTRSQNTCEHPNCNKAATEIHHATPYSQNHTHDPNKMHHLCHEHHQLFHHGFITNQDLSPSNWQTSLTPTQTKTDQLAIKYRQAARAG